MKTISDYQETMRKILANSARVKRHQILDEVERQKAVKRIQQLKIK